MGKSNTSRRELILSLYEQGLGGITIAKQLSLHPQTVYYYLKDIKKPNGGRQAKTSVDEVVQLYELGLSCQQIADKLNLSDGGVVWTRLKNAGIKLRSKSEGMKARGCRKIGSDEEIVKLYQKGWRQIDIAAKYGVHIGSVSRILNKYGVNEGNYGKRNTAWKGVK